MPNAGATGYYRWSLDGASLAALRAQGLRQLDDIERLSYADSVRASFAAGTRDTGDVLGALEPLATSDMRPLADAPMEIVEFSWEYLLDDAQRPAAQAYARRLYTPAFRRLGWEAPRRARETDDVKMLRARVIEVLALFAEDASVRREAVRRGRLFLGLDPERRARASDPPTQPRIVETAVSADLVGAVLAVTAQEDGATFVDALISLLPTTQDAVHRRAILHALGSVRDPAIAARVRQLTLDPRIRDNEWAAILGVQLGDPRTRDAAWQWVRTNLDPLFARMGSFSGAYLPWYVAGGCTAEWAADVGATLQPRVNDLPGGPRNLAGAVEAVRLCAARASHQRASARTFFTAAPAGATPRPRTAAGAN
jgi:alanyl aminopeptidase